METVPPPLHRFPSFLLVLMLAFGVYLAGLLPFVYWADSSELTLGGFLLGLSHAPSFPLYALLVKGLNFLPLGDVAFKASLVSALCGALGVAGVFALARVLCRAALIPEESSGETGLHTRDVSRAASEVAILTAFLYGVSGPAWQVACRQEVYTLHFITAFFILGTLLAWAKDSHPRWLYLAGFAFGLGMGNHSLLMLALFPPILLFLLVTQARAVLQPRVLLWATGAFLLGLSIYLYLPLRSATQPLLDTNDPETLSGFLDSFTKRTEKGLFVGESGWFEHLQVFAAQLVDAFTPSLVWLGAFGILPWFRQQGWKWATFLGLLMAFSVFSVVMGPEYTWDNPDIPGYLLLTYALFAVLLGTGVARVLDGLTRGRSHAHWIRRGVVLGIAALAWFTASTRLPGSGDARAADYGRLHLETAPLGALLVVKSDAAHFIPYYQQIAEGRRPDLALVNRKGVANLAYIAQVSRWDETVFAPHPSPVKLPTQAPDSGASTARKSWDTSYALEADVRALVANSLPRRVVLWEPGGDNRWAVPLSRPLGPWLELNPEPIQLGPTDHAQNLRFQQTVRQTLAPPDVPVDPRANQALEVICYNLSNTLWRDMPATPAQRAEGYGGLWKVRPDFLPAGLQFAHALEEQAHYAEASQVYTALLELAPQEARIVEGLRRVQAGLQGEGP